MLRIKTNSEKDNSPQAAEKQKEPQPESPDLSEMSISITSDTLVIGQEEKVSKKAEENSPEKQKYEPKPTVIPIILNGQNSADRMKEITDRLETGIQELFESERYKAYLASMAKFHNYSFNNTLLIAMQGGQLVAGYNKWRDEFHRNVKRGEKGIKILAPVPYKTKKEVPKLDEQGQPVKDKDGNPVTEQKEIQVLSFKIASVFDISQTEGEPLPSLGVNELAGNVEQYENFFKALEQTSPVPIAFEDIPGGSHGYYHLMEKRIAIQENMSELQTLKTAIHEIAHAKLHAVDPEAPMTEQTDRPDSRTREVQAESVAYTVCHHYGLDTSDYSFGYVAGWSSGKDLKELRASLETIQATAHELITTIDGHLAEFQQQWQTQPAPDSVLSELPPEQQKKMTDHMKVMLQTMIDADMKSTGEIMQGALDAIQTQDIVLSDGDMPQRAETQQELQEWNGIDGLLNRKPIMPGASPKERANVLIEWAERDGQRMGNEERRLIVDYAEAVGNTDKVIELINRLCEQGYEMQHGHMDELVKNWIDREITEAKSAESGMTVEEYAAAGYEIPAQEQVQGETKISPQIKGGNFMPTEEEMREYALESRMPPGNVLKGYLNELSSEYQNDPYKLEELLEFKSRFYNYSVNNSMLIRQYDPNATFVASPQTWEKLGYEVVQKEKAIPILYPIESLYFVDPQSPKKQNGQPNLKKVEMATEWEKEQIQQGNIQTQKRTTFQRRSAFDITATNCPPEDYDLIRHTGHSPEQHPAMYQSLREYIQQQGLTVEEADLSEFSLRGEYHPAENRVILNSQMDDTQKLDTLLHQFGHYIIQTAAPNVPEAIREMEADAVTIMMSKQAGIEISDIRKQHFAASYQEAVNIPGFDLEKAMDTVNRVYRTWRVETDPLVQNALFEQQVSLEPEAPYLVEEPWEQQTEQENYRLLEKIAPEIVSGKRKSLRLERPGEESLLVERNGDRISIAQTYQKSHTDIANPNMDFVLLDGDRLSARNYQLDNAAGHYESAERGQNVDRNVLHRLNEMASKWLSYLEKTFPHTREVTREESPGNPSLRERFSDKMESIEKGIRHNWQERKRAQERERQARWEEKSLAEIQYLRDLDILQVARDMGFTPVQRKNHWTLREHDSVVFYDNNTFVRYSQEKGNGRKVGGSPIDFYAHFNNLLTGEAIREMKETYIRGRELTGYRPREQPKKEKEKKPFLLPEAEKGPWRRMSAYLTKTRGIDPDVVQHCIDKKLLYEEAGYHNTVFVGRDHTNQAVFASKRSSLPSSKFRMDVEGSNQENGWQVNHPDAKLLVLTEAPIDAMSAMCIRKHLGRPVESANYLASCGTGKAISVLRNYMKKHPEITAIRIGMDNDDAGRKAAQNLRTWLKDEYPNVKVGGFIALPEGRDLNDAWRGMKPQGKTPAAKPPARKRQNTVEVE